MGETIVSKVQGGKKGGGAKQESKGGKAPLGSPQIRLCSRVHIY